jgi:hypothetical protein
VHSPDGNWWWDGALWQPAVSPDGTYRFDGTTWRPRDPKPASSKRKVILVVTVVLGLVGFVGSTFVYAIASGNAHDGRSLDDAAIIQAATAGCLAVTNALEQPGSDRLQGITAGNAAIRRLIARMEAAGTQRLQDDSPAVDWVADWQRLHDARADFAGRLTNTGVGVFAIPQTDDGFPISQRLTDVAPSECARAVQLSVKP